MALDYGKTTNFLLRWLKGDNAISDIDEGFRSLAEDVDQGMLGFVSDSQAKRPPAGTPNKVFHNNDHGTLQRDTGAVFESILTSPISDLRVQAGRTSLGSLGSGFTTANVPLTSAWPNLHLAFMAGGRGQTNDAGFVLSGEDVLDLGTGLVVVNNNTPQIVVVNWVSFGY